MLVFFLKFRLYLIESTRTCTITTNKYFSYETSSTWWNLTSTKSHYSCVSRIVSVLLLFVITDEVTDSRNHLKAARVAGTSLLWDNLRTFLNIIAKSSLTTVSLYINLKYVYDMYLIDIILWRVRGSNKEKHVIWKSHLLWSILENYTNSNTRQHVHKTWQHEKTRVQHDTTQVKHGTTRAKYDTTRVHHVPTRVHQKLRQQK